MEHEDIGQYAKRLEKQRDELLEALEGIAWSRPLGQKPSKAVEALERQALAAIANAKGA